MLAASHGTGDTGLSTSYPSGRLTSGRKTRVYWFRTMPPRANRGTADQLFHCWRRSRARRRTGGKPGARGAGLSSRLVRKFARRPFWSTKRNRSLWTARRNRSFWTAGGCRSFWTSATGRRRPAGRLLRRRPLPDLSQSGGSPAGARPVRSRSQRRAAVAARRGARRMIGVCVDGQAHEPVNQAPALFASWCAITRGRNLLARRNVSLGSRSICGVPSEPSGGQENIRREIVQPALLWTRRPSPSSL